MATVYIKKFAYLLKDKSVKQRWQTNEDRASVCRFSFLLALLLATVTVVMLLGDVCG